LQLINIKAKIFQEVISMQFATKINRNKTKNSIIYIISLQKSTHKHFINKSCKNSLDGYELFYRQKP